MARRKLQKKKSPAKTLLSDEDLAADVAARMRIAKTLDVDAFDQFHKANAAINARYWAAECGLAIEPGESSATL